MKVRRGRKGSRRDLQVSSNMHSAFVSKGEDVVFNETRGQLGPCITKFLVGLGCESADNHITLEYV